MSHRHYPRLMEMGKVQGERHYFAPGEAPMPLIRLAYAEYAKRHGSQSLETLQRRGGFGWIEIIACLRGEYNAKGMARVAEELREIIEP